MYVYIMPRSKDISYDLRKATVLFMNMGNNLQFTVPQREKKVHLQTLNLLEGVLSFPHDYTCIRTISCFRKRKYTGINGIRTKNDQVPNQFSKKRIFSRENRVIAHTNPTVF